MKNKCKKMAKLIARKLTKTELISLATTLDEDANNDFCFYIQEQCCKIAPELYGSVDRSFFESDIITKE